MSKTTGLEIAVIGMACRFPGAKNIEEFWENIKTGTESITFFSKEELMEAGVPKEQLDHKNYVRAKGKVDLHDHFDAAFFGYSQREAEVMDPQVRMFHEVAWESLENAGYNPETYSQPIGLFGAASANLYWQASSMLLRSSSSSEQFAAVQLTDKDFMNTQISYKLNLKGPSIAVDTACSSSLTAVHLASRALLTGDCKMALAGGVTVTCPHKKGYMYQEGMIMSPDGRCRAFDAEAKGTVGGEGCGVVVLKTLKQALKDQDHIYAVIKGSAYNNDGSRKVGYTAPSIEGQADVIRKALNISRVESESISYVEAHGTGTSLGDPVEIEALKQAFQTEKKQFCAIGSVKTNIGHLDSAAGIAGFIKTALSLKARTLPPSLHYKKPNPKIDFENSPFYVSTSAKQWTASDRVFRAGVSSFGIGGTNVHVVMEEPPMKERRHQEDHEDCLMLISARSEKAAMKAADQVKQFIKENEEVPLQDVSYTLQEGRRHFQYRQAFTAGPLGITSDMENSSIALEKPAVVFMFSGQGSQYVNMGKQLYEMEPVFQEELERCFTILQAEEGLNIRSIMFPANEAESIEAEQLIHETSYTQPILFSFEYALASFLNKKGLKPQYMIGHSIGELTAACLSGICSLEDALHMVAMRGQLMQEMPEGEMLSVRLSSRETEMELTEGVELSASNSSDLSVVSGLMEPINAFAARLQAKGVAIQHLKTSHAFHSSMMKPAASRFADILQDMEFKAPGLPFISNVTGDWIQAEQATDPKYWASQIMEKVDFHSGLNTLLQMSNVVFVEIGPGNTLTQFVRKHEGFMTEQHAAVNMIRHPKEVSSDRVYLLNRIGRLWTHGVNMNWEHFRQGGSYERVPLPTYPFEHQVFPDPQTSQGGMEEKIKNELRLNVASSEKQLPFDKWFSVPFWERMEPVNETFTHQGKRILVFEENSNVSQYLLKQQAEAVSVQPGDYFAETDRNTFTVNHRDTAHFRKLLDELNARGFIPDEIIWMWLQDCDCHDGDIAEHTIAGYLPLLDLVRLLGTESNKRFSMTVVTKQAHDVTGMEDLQPHQAALTGVCLTIPQEYKQISCKAVDLCPDPRLGQSSWPEMISYELKKEDDQPIVAYRGNSRWIRQAKQPRKQDEIDMAGNLRHKGVYIITGGLGGIGLSLASHLAETVQAKLVLLSRTGLPDKLRANDDTAKKLKAVEELEKAGAEVLVLQADISDETELQKALQTAESRFGQAIHGVIHAAGIPDGKVIHARTPDDERHMAKAKITGTALLRKALRNKQPDFFFICSSLVSFLGAGGQVGYAASNAFLDSYAHACRKEGENMVTVNWDRWEQVGMAYESETAAILSKIADKEEQHQGILPAQGAKAFMRALQLRYPQVLISLQDVNKRMKDSYVKEDRQTAAHVLTKDRLDTLEERLMNIFKDYFHSETDVNMNFFELGASSLDLLQVSGRIKNELGVDIPVVMMYAHPTVAALTQAVKAQQSGDDLHIKGIEPDRQKAINEGKNRRKQRMRRK